MPDFPNELVEAAAVVCYSLAPEHGRWLSGVRDDS